MDQTQPQQTQSSLFAGMPLRDKSLCHVADPSANPVRHKRSKLAAHECPPPLMRPSHNPATNRNPSANRNPSVIQPVFGPTAPPTVSVPSPVQVSSLFQRPSAKISVVSIHHCRSASSLLKGRIETTLILRPTPTDRGCKPYMKSSAVSYFRNSGNK